MPRRVWFTALLVLAGTALPAPAQTRLEWNFKEGDQFFAEVVTTLKGVVVLKGERLEQDALTTMVLGFKVLKKTGDAYEMEEFIEGVMVRKTGPTTMLLAELLERLNGTKPNQPRLRPRFTFTLAPTGAVTNFKGYAEALKVIAGQNAGVLPMLRAVFPKSSLQQSAESVFVVLPAHVIQPGETWGRSMKVVLGPLGSLDVDSRYKYEGPGKEGAQIAQTATLAYVPPTGDSSPFPFKITGGSLKADKATGIVVFNATAGRLVRSELKLHFKGSLTLEAGKRKDTLQVEEDRTVSIRILDKNPIPHS